MPVVFVIHAREDREFVEGRLLHVLPALGYDRWLPGGPVGTNSEVLFEPGIAPGLVIAVISSAAARSDWVRHEVLANLRHGRRVVPLQIDGTRAGDVASELDALAVVDARSGNGLVSLEELGERLQQLLPHAAGKLRADSRTASEARTIAWNGQVFSSFLSRALARHDQSQCDELVTRFADRLGQGEQAYEAEHAREDLGMLRRSRQFGLMQRYARAVLASGVRDFTVERQYAQSLIELGGYDAAIALLTRIVSESGDHHSESYEARGLLGRAYKQMYVNAPGREAGGLLERAIGYYLGPFREDAQLVWHGINAASCLLRAHRDGFRRDAAPARQLAGEVLGSLATLEADRRLSAFELATRVEAHALLEQFESAGDALAIYLAHPDAHAFEVSSTLRQFEQVLSLQQHPAGRVLVSRLREAVERHRAPGALRPEHARHGTRMSLVLRVTDPDWQPTGVPDCVVHGRLGTVIAIEGSRNTIEALLKDPLVVAVDESRRSSDARECARSLPLIRVVRPFPCDGGPFEETGAHALVAVLDDGIDVLHAAFLDAQGRSRLVGVWDQRDQTGPAPAGFKFGTYYDASDIARFVAQGSVPEKLGRNEDGHGTHVASIAAGRAAGQFAGGVAPDARLLFVIANVRDPIGYSQEHIAALEFIDKTARELGLPVVVNVSQGMHAGAHDGRSALEAAFDAFSRGGREPGRVIVKSAGNAGQSNGHALVKVPHRNVTALEWVRHRDPDWEFEYIELWWDSANSYEFTLISPGGDRSSPVDASHQKSAGDFASCPYQMLLVRRHVDNGDSQLKVEIGSLTGDEAVVDAGTWTLEIAHVEGDAPREIHAWIERGPRPVSEFRPPHASNDMTLTVPGTAHNVITVGAVNATNAARVATAPFSSYGPTRDNRSKPDVSAPGVAIAAARGGTTDEAFEDRGTSMAAPHVSGAIALLLSRAVATGMTPWPASTQIAAALRQKTLNRNPHWDPGQGYGVIDVTALLNAF
jgi:endonuclease G